MRESARPVGRACSYYRYKLMKKLSQYLRSMRFGLLLLGLIAACSVIGTVIPQGREIAWYAQTYRSFHGAILFLKLNDILLCVYIPHFAYPKLTFRSFPPFGY